MNCLPDKYCHFHSAWDSLSEAEKSLSKLLERLRQEEQRMKSREVSSVENALMSRGKSKSANKGQNKNSQEKRQSSSGKANSNQSSQQSSKLKCFKCGKEGHKKAVCYGKPCQEYIDYCKKHYKCNVCQESGHFAKECPKGEKKGGKSFISINLFSAEINSISDDRNSWYKDSGATHHMTSNLHWMTNIKSLRETTLVKIGDSTELKAVSTGDVNLSAYDGEKWYPITLRQVLFVPNLSFNLFSLTTVLDKGYTQQADAKISKILENGKTVLIAERSGGLFRMKVCQEQECSLTAVSIKVWHERLAHQNVGYIKDILKRNNITYIDDWNGYVCEGCAYGKQCRVSHRLNSIIAKECLDIVHVDLGEMNEYSLGGSKYFLIFKDDYSHFRTVYFLKQKSEAVNKLEVYLNLVENQFNRQVKILKSDNGTEITNTKSRNMLERLGIFHQRSAEYTPEQNGRVEREMRTLVEVAPTQIHAQGLDTKLWAEALNYSVFTINQTGTSSVKGKSPADLWFGRRISVKQLKSFGCECYVLSPECQRKKLDKKSSYGIFVGYDVEEQGFRVYIPEKGEVDVSCNVLFKEKFNLKESTVELNLSLNEVQGEESKETELSKSSEKSNQKVDR